MPAAGYESHEYDRLVNRGFRPYSIGHRRMYTTAIKAISLRAEPVNIFEAGFGIGWGLDQMLDAGIVKSYIGVEPNNASFKYTNDRLGLNPRVSLVHEGFEQAISRSTVPSHNNAYDEVFCIEVIEHVPLDEQLQFLKTLRRLAPRLWLSTPDMDSAPSEGVRTTQGWVHLLKLAGFDSITVDLTNWTYLYECKA